CQACQRACQVFPTARRQPVDLRRSRRATRQALSCTSDLHGGQLLDGVTHPTDQEAGPRKPISVVASPAFSAVDDLIRSRLTAALCIPEPSNRPCWSVSVC